MAELPDLTDYEKRLAQLNDLFAVKESAWKDITRDDLVYYLTTMLLWHELSITEVEIETWKEQKETMNG